MDWLRRTLMRLLVKALVYRHGTYGDALAMFWLIERTPMPVGLPSWLQLLEGLHMLVSRYRTQEQKSIRSRTSNPPRDPTMQVIYTWPDGREEVRYERPDGSDGAKALEREVQELHRLASEHGYASPYSIRKDPPRERP